MATTTPDNLPYPSVPGDPADAIPAFQALAQGVQTALNGKVPAARRINVGNGIKRTAGAVDLTSDQTLAVDYVTNGGLTLSGGRLTVDDAWLAARYSGIAHGHAYAAATHYHPADQAAIRRGRFNAGSLDPGKAYGPWTVAHGLGGVPAAVFACADNDDATHSVVTSCGTFDGTNLNITARNLGNNAESVWISWMVVG